MFTYFSLEQKGKFPAPLLSFLSPEDFRDAFCVAGGAFGRHWLRWIRRLTQRTQDFTMKGGSRRAWGMARRSGGRKSPSGVQRQSLGRGPGRRPPEAEAKCEIAVQLSTFSCRKFMI